MRTARVLLLSLLPLACVAPVGVSGLEVPEDGLAQCQSQCGVMGMRAGAVVAMAGRIGCVCEPAESTAHGDDDSPAALAGGMAAIVLEEERQQRAAALR